MKIDDVKPSPRLALTKYILGLNCDDEVFELNEVCARLDLINNTWIRKLLTADKELADRNTQIGSTFYVGSPKAIVRLKRKFA